MPTNEGNLVEQEVIYELNNRKIKDLSNNMRNLMRCLFGVLDNEFIVKCYKVDDINKTDFVIEYNNQKKNVSMKSGKAVVIHNEILENFINFLKEEGISQKTLDTICLFHYGDGTVDGSNPENRKKYGDVSLELKERIKEANKELNNNMDFVLKVMHRCLFKGSQETNIEADCIYFGDKDYGIVATQRQFVKSVSRGAFHFFDHLHIGRIFIRPDARYVGKEITHERKRNRIIAYWPHLREDIEYMSKRYNY